MPRNKNIWTQEKFKRFIKEGRGQGEGINYKPFWTINDFATKGRASRVLGNKTGRIHHFFSDIEKNLFLLLDWDENNNITDIREHYPLLNIEETVDNHEDLAFNKFTDKETNEPYVITTTFLITLRSLGKEKLIARSVKGSAELNRDISIERLEIERRYWEAKDIHWGIVTDKEIPKIKCKNIEWIHSALRESSEFGMSNNDRDYYKELFKELLLAGNYKIRDIMGHFEESNSLNGGAGLYIFKYLVASKEIKIDMNKEIAVDKFSNDLILEVEGKEYGTIINS